MAAINSLAYLVYSVLTLASNNKPTSDPSLNAWQIGQEPPVTEWNQESHYDPLNYNEESCPEGETWSDCGSMCPESCESGIERRVCPEVCIPGCVCDSGTIRGPGGNCIRPELCPSADVDPDETVSAEKYPEIPDVDPDETVSAEKDPEIPDGKLNAFGCPSDVLECAATCRRKGFKIGICAGSSNLTCYCSIFGAKEEKKFQGGELNSDGCPSEVECSKNCKRKGYEFGICKDRSGDDCVCYKRLPKNDPDFPRGDPDETVSVQRYPVFLDDKLNSDAFSREVECSINCVEKGYEGGMCGGRSEDDCFCFKPLPKNDPDFPRVDPDETVSAEKNPEIPDGKLNYGVCPSKCNATCIKMEFEEGICGGISDLTCICFSYHGIFKEFILYETVSAEKDPEIPDGKFQGNGCPVERNCIDWCRRRKHATGHCIGNDKSFCRCG